MVTRRELTEEEALQDAEVLLRTVDRCIDSARDDAYKSALRMHLANALGCVQTMRKYLSHP